MGGGRFAEATRGQLGKGLDRITGHAALCTFSERWQTRFYVNRARTSPKAGGSLCRQSPIFLVKQEGGALSRVGASRSTRYLIESIREPSKDLTEGMMEPNNPYGFPVVYDTITALTKDGRRITGVPKNEDTFSLQLIDRGEQLYLFLKKDLEQVIHERKSLMPAYNERMLSENELQDLLAYLDSLRGPIGAGPGQADTFPRVAQTCRGLACLRSAKRIPCVEPPATSATLGHTNIRRHQEAMSAPPAHWGN